MGCLGRLRGGWRRSGLPGAHREHTHVRAGGGCSRVLEVRRYGHRHPFPLLGVERWRTRRTVDPDSGDVQHMQREGPGNSLSERVCLRLTVRKCRLVDDEQGPGVVRLRLHRVGVARSRGLVHAGDVGQARARLDILPRELRRRDGRTRSAGAAGVGRSDHVREAHQEHQVRDDRDQEHGDDRSDGPEAGVVREVVAVDLVDHHGQQERQCERPVDRPPVTGVASMRSDGVDPRSDHEREPEGDPGEHDEQGVGHECPAEVRPPDAPREVGEQPENGEPDQRPEQ